MLYIFDKDNTLVASLGERPANQPDEQIPLPGVAAKLAELRAQGYQLAVASNQGGVAWGYLTTAQVQALMDDLTAKLGPFDAIEWSPYDPRAKGKRRHPAYARDDESCKPRPGMLLAIMTRLNASPAATVMVGDQESDKQAAEAAGCCFVWAQEMFGWV
jgi:D-glycero-D-manno-heptose 1,7-bisphosphate phosphatase